jgi:hypothetical protein
MKGMETNILLAIILAVAVLVVVVLVVVIPSLNQAESSENQITFREFCFHWSILGYTTEKDKISIGKYEYFIDTECARVGANDREVCVRMCKGAA